MSAMNGGRQIGLIRHKTAIAFLATKGSALATVEPGFRIGPA